VHEVELMRRKLLTTNVVATRFEVRKRQSLKKPWINVRGEHAPGSSNPRAEPGGDRSAAAADFQTRPALIYAPLFYVADRLRVVKSRQFEKPRPGSIAGIIKYISSDYRYLISTRTCCFHIHPHYVLNCPYCLGLQTTFKPLKIDMPYESFLPDH